LLARTPSRTKADADRVTELDGVQPVTYRGFSVVGVEREADVRKDDLNTYWTWFMQKLRSALGSPFGKSVASASRLVPYLDKVVIVLKVSGQTEPVFIDSEPFQRVGTETVEVPKSDYMRIYGLFQKKQSLSPVPRASISPGLILR
jgi:hypothetical protein